MFGEVFPTFDAKQVTLPYHQLLREERDGLNSLRSLSHPSILCIAGKGHIRTLMKAVFIEFVTLYPLQAVGAE